MILALQIVGVVEVVGLVCAVALCRAAARRPIVIPRTNEEH